MGWGHILMNSVVFKTAIVCAGIWVKFTIIVVIFALGLLVAGSAPVGFLGLLGLLGRFLHWRVPYLDNNIDEQNLGSDAVDCVARMETKTKKTKPKNKSRKSTCSINFDGPIA
jgi:hypothetical protein